jgi:hypothetical protein
MGASVVPMRSLIVGIAALMVLTGCAAPPARPATDITSITFSQYQAIENFDDSEYTQNDRSQVAIFAALLDQFDVVPGVTITAVEDDCAGGLSSTVTVEYSEGPQAQMFIASCGKPEYDTFNQQVNRLLTEWRTELSGT